MNDEIRSHSDLLVWQWAMDLVVDCYNLARNFPDSERNGLTSQVQRAAVSIPSIIAEGRNRGSRKSFANFLWIANGSLAEPDAQLDLATRLNHVTADQTNNLHKEINIIGRMITKLRQSLDNNS